MKSGLKDSAKGTLYVLMGMVFFFVEGMKYLPQYSLAIAGISLGVITLVLIMMVYLQDEDALSKFWENDLGAVSIMASFQVAWSLVAARIIQNINDYTILHPNIVTNNQTQAITSSNYYYEVGLPAIGVYALLAGIIPLVIYTFITFEDSGDRLSLFGKMSALNLVGILGYGIVYGVVNYHPHFVLRDFLNPQLIPVGITIAGITVITYGIYIGTKRKDEE